MKTIHYISLILGMAILLFSACDPGVSYSKVIQNNSKYDISLYTDTAYAETYAMYNFDTIVIEKHSIVVIASEQGIGTTNGFSSCCIFNDSLNYKIIGFDSLYLNLDLNDCSNWVFDVIDKSAGGGGVCECRIKITDSMIK